MGGLQGFITQFTDAKLSVLISTNNDASNL